MFQRSRIASLATAACLLSCGCMPEAKAPVVTGPIDTTTASQLQGQIRISNGDRYTVEHECNGKAFTANWELGNAFKKNAKLQLKPPGDWSEADVYQALEVVLNAPASKPWYSQVDDTILRLFREGSRPTTIVPLACRPRHLTTSPSKSTNTRPSGSSRSGYKSSTRTEWPWGSEPPCLSGRRLLGPCQPQVQFIQLGRVDLAGGFGHQIGGLLRFWKRDHFANIVQSRKQHHPAVDPQRDAAVGRCTVLQVR